MILSFSIEKYRTQILWAICIGFSLFGLSPLFKPVIIAVILSYLLNKPITYLAGYHLPRSLSSLLFITMIIAFLVGFVIIVIPFIHDNVLLISQKIPCFLDFIGIQFKKMSQRILLGLGPETSIKCSQIIQDHLFSLTQQFLMSALGWFQKNLEIKNLIYYCFIMPVMIYYMSIDFPKIVRFFIHLFPLSKRVRIQRITKDMDKIFFLYFTGQSLVSLLLMLSYAVCLYLVGLDHPLILGILVGLLSFIPYVGSSIGILMVSAIALAQQDPSWSLVINLGISFFCLSILETQVLLPRLVGKRIGVAPLVFILAIVIANYYFGVLGMFLAYPLTATIIRLREPQV